MGRRTPGIYQSEDGKGWQINAMYKGQRIRQRGFKNAEEAEEYLVRSREEIRRVKVLGESQKYTLDVAAAHYVQAEAERGKVSLVSEIHLLKRVIREIGDLTLDKVSQQTIQPFVDACKRDGLKNKSINNSLAIIIRICNLAARAWRDENGNPWLNIPPLIRKLDLNDQRPPRPITWEEQRKLVPLLPPHLAKMVLFNLHTGVREDVVCKLNWNWEVRVQLDNSRVSVFVVPKEYVKGRKRSRVLVCNSVAQGIIDAERGKHPERVFTYRGEPINSMNNTAWQRCRKEAFLGDLHIHDLRHTVGMRLREAGVSEATISDVLWHSRQSMTAHYSAAQVKELYEALELIKSDAGRVNVSLLSLVRKGESFNQNFTSKEKAA